MTSARANTRWLVWRPKSIWFENAVLLNSFTQIQCFLSIRSVTHFNLIVVFILTPHVVLNWYRFNEPNTYLVSAPHGFKWPKSECCLISIPHSLSLSFSFFVSPLRFFVGYRNTKLTKELSGSAICGCHKENRIPQCTSIVESRLIRQWLSSSVHFIIILYYYLPKLLSQVICQIRYASLNLTGT